MMTVITYVNLKEGAAVEWDAAMRDRMAAARARQGWVQGQLLMPLDDVTRRAIVGTWKSRSDWEAWHTDPAFAETRRRLEDLEAESGETTWFEIIAEGATITDSANRLARQVMDTARRSPLSRRAMERADRLREGRKGRGGSQL